MFSNEPQLTWAQNVDETLQQAQAARLAGDVVQHRDAQHAVAAAAPVRQRKGVCHRDVRLSRTACSLEILAAIYNKRVASTPLSLHRDAQHAIAGALPVRQRKYASVTVTSALPVLPMASADRRCRYSMREASTIASPLWQRKGVRRRHVLVCRAARNS